MTIKFHWKSRIVVSDIDNSALCASIYGIQLGGSYFGLQRWWIEQEWHTGLVRKLPVNMERNDKRRHLEVKSSMNHITNEQIFDLIKDIPNLELFLDNRVIQWHNGYFTIQSRGIDYILRPEDVLAIVVDAAKREMGKDWFGCDAVMVDRQKKIWRAGFHKPQQRYRQFEASTEAAAVLAAFKAWKEKI